MRGRGRALKTPSWGQVPTGFKTPLQQLGHPRLLVQKRNQVLFSAVCASQAVGTSFVQSGHAAKSKEAQLHASTRDEVLR